MRTIVNGVQDVIDSEAPASVALTRLILFVADVERLAQFYVHAFGLGIVGEMTSEWVVLQAGECELALHRAGEAFRDGAPQSSRENNNVKIVLTVDGDVAALRNKLLAFGVPLGELRSFAANAGPHCDGIDPEGNVFQIVGVEAPGANGSRHDPVLRSTSAQLYVTDVTASCAFFTDRLGFTIDFVYGDPPYYGEVTRDDARLALRLVRETVFAGDIREREELLAASITVATADEIRLLFASYKNARVRFHQTLTTQPWDAMTFVVSDPDGNLILFAGPAD